MQLTGCCLAKSLHYTFDRDLRGYLALILATYPVCKSEKPSMGTRLCRTFRRKMAKKIFVMIANQSRIAQLRELKIQHRCVFVRKIARDFNSLPGTGMSGQHCHPLARSMC